MGTIFVVNRNNKVVATGLKNFRYQHFALFLLRDIWCTYSNNNKALAKKYLLYRGCDLNQQPTIPSLFLLAKKHLPFSFLYSDLRFKFPKEVCE